VSGFLGNQDIGMCVYLSYTYFHANMTCTIIHVTFVYLNMQIQTRRLKSYIDYHLNS